MALKKRMTLSTLMVREHTTTNTYFYIIIYRTMFFLFCLTFALKKTDSNHSRGINYDSAELPPC